MIKVIYIGGIGHSGSTFLDIMLGDCKDCQSTGQLADVFRNDSWCRACGTSIQKCRFWNQIYGSMSGLDLKRIRKLGPKAEKERKILSFMFPTKLSKAYAKANDKVFSAIKEKTKKGAIVDSSKNLSRALSLLRYSRHQVYFIHLIRDPRGFITSQNKRREKKGKSIRLLYPMIHWLLKNSVCSLIIKNIYRKRYIRVTFEDLLMNPKRCISEIEKLTQSDMTIPKKKLETRQAFTQKHIFSGNFVSTKKKVLFDDTRIKSNRLEFYSDCRYWYTIGWLSWFFGYRKRQSYLED